MNYHQSILQSLKKFKTYKSFKKYLKQFGLTNSEQRMLIRDAKKAGQDLQ